MNKNIWLVVTLLTVILFCTVSSYGYWIDRLTMECNMEMLYPIDFQITDDTQLPDTMGGNTEMQDKDTTAQNEQASVDNGNPGDVEQGGTEGETANTHGNGNDDENVGKQGSQDEGSENLQDPERTEERSDDSQESDDATNTSDDTTQE